MFMTEKSTIIASKMGFLAMKAGTISFLLLGTISSLARLLATLSWRVLWNIGALALCRGGRLCFFLGW